MHNPPERSGPLDVERQGIDVGEVVDRKLPIVTPQGENQRPTL